MAYRFEPLTKQHDRAAFRCASAPLNIYLRQIARKDAERHVAAAFVMVDEAAPAAIVGYYTLSAFAVDVTELPEAMQRKLPRYPRLPATLLGRLARDERFPGTGSLLLMDALARAHQKSAEIASLAVVADAKDEAALTFYRKFGFARLGSDPKRVFLPMGTIAELVGKPV
ncbi:MAG TPA: GNAT family N-acetyltransferase [Opitutaceae bacterium]|nr:GNAT family N-acetyltransferase [Opitutaceae bacterium]